MEPVVKSFDQVDSVLPADEVAACTPTASIPLTLKYVKNLRLNLRLKFETCLRWLNCSPDRSPNKPAGYDQSLVSSGSRDKISR